MIRILEDFLSVDPHSEKYVSSTPYHYVHDNPIIMVDPDGKDAVVTINGNTITVSTQIYIYGEGASTSMADRIKSSINAEWSNNNWEYTDSDGNVFNVVFDVNVDVYDSENPSNNPLIIPDSWDSNSTNNYIKIIEGEGRSYVQSGDEGKWYNGGENWAFAHEWGI